jgi:hypothetical protein
VEIRWGTSDNDIIELCNVTDLEVLYYRHAHILDSQRRIFREPVPHSGFKSTAKPGELTHFDVPDVGVIYEFDGLGVDGTTIITSCPVLRKLLQVSAHGTKLR